MVYGHHPVRYTSFHPSTTAGPVVSRRSRSQKPCPGTSHGESQRSKSYRQGRTFRYRYRIAGPTFPVTTWVDKAMAYGVLYPEDDLEGGS